jgi:hypothetical protein
LHAKKSGKRRGMASSANLTRRWRRLRSGFPAGANWLVEGV